MSRPTRRSHPHPSDAGSSGADSAGGSPSRGTIEGRVRGESRERRDAAPPPDRDEFYCLDMFPYPSPDGFGVDQLRGIAITDVVARYQQHLGKKVFRPMGWDAFGLTVENEAASRGVDPRDIVREGIDVMTDQLERFGARIDGESEVVTSDPKFYRGTQWIFEQLFERDLAYRADRVMKWCPTESMSLANEEVIDGRCIHCNTDVTERMFPQWHLRTTEYAERLHAGLRDLEWPERVKSLQRHWIGRREGYRLTIKATSELQYDYAEFPAFIRNLEWIPGITYIVLAPEHPFIERFTDSLYREDVQRYRERVSKRTERERLQSSGAPSGLPTGAYAIHPWTLERIPIWVSEMVIPTFRWGAVLGVPGHVAKHRPFAERYRIQSKVVTADRESSEDSKPRAGREADDSMMINVGTLAGATVAEARRRIRARLEARGSIEPCTTYALRDWVFCRQRAWGEPIPILYSDQGAEPVAEGDLPVELPALTSEILGQKAVLTSDPTAELEATPVAPLEESSREESSLDKASLGDSSRADPADGEDPADPDADADEDTFDADPFAENVASPLTDGVAAMADEFAPQSATAVADDPAEGWQLWDASVDDEGGPLGEIDRPSPITGPLAKIESFRTVRDGDRTLLRETDVMPQWAGSCWYYLRYLDPNSEKMVQDPKLAKKWMPVDLCVGGIEHAVLHLLYVRFVAYFLYDLDMTPQEEPFRKLFNQGRIFRKEPDRERLRSARRTGDRILAEPYLETFGGDALRLHLLFIGRPSEDVLWNESGLRGARRFLHRARAFVHSRAKSGRFVSRKVLVEKHRLIRRVSRAIDSFKINKGVSAFMEFVKVLTSDRVTAEEVDRETLETFVLLLSPFAPFLAKELWTELGRTEPLDEQPWPEHSKELLKPPEVDLVIQIDNRKRDRIRLEKELPKNLLIEEVLKRDRVREALGDRIPDRVIVVPGRLVNIVTTEIG